VIRFRLDPRSGVPPYRQLVDQVRQAVLLGILRPGDQLPPVREVVTQITINPNTVHRAYRELEDEGIVEGRQGIGTFVSARAGSPVTPQRQLVLHEELLGWIGRARKVGMTDDAIVALVSVSMSMTGIDAKELRQ
jgi:GntR family transcriptional regulator